MELEGVGSDEMSEAHGWNVCEGPAGEMHVVPADEVHTLAQWCVCSPRFEAGADIESAGVWVHRKGE
jgi:hypothetical protein